MIKINLIPEEYKKKAQKPKKTAQPIQFDLPKLGPKLKKIAVYVLSALAGLHILVGFLVFSKSVSLKGIESRWEKLRPSQAELAKLNSEIGALEKMIVPVRQLAAKRAPWARQTNQLSDLMVPGVWLTKLFVQSQIKDAKTQEYTRVLNLEGCAAALYGDEAALIAKFVKAMQSDKDFFKYFTEIKLGPLERALLDKTPVMNFKIYCFYKKT